MFLIIASTDDLNGTFDREAVRSSGGARRIGTAEGSIEDDDEQQEKCGERNGEEKRQCKWLVVRRSLQQAHDEASESNDSTGRQQSNGKTECFENLRPFEWIGYSIAGFYVLCALREPVGSRGSCDLISLEKRRATGQYIDDFQSNDINKPTF